MESKGKKQLISSGRGKGKGKLGDIDQRVQISSYKKSKFSGSNVWLSNYSIIYLKAAENRS